MLLLILFNLFIEDDLNYWFDKFQNMFKLILPSYFILSLENRINLEKMTNAQGKGRTKDR